MRVCAYECAEVNAASQLYTMKQTRVKQRWPPLCRSARHLRFSRFCFHRTCGIDLGALIRTRAHAHLQLQPRARKHKHKTCELRALSGVHTLGKDQDRWQPELLAAVAPGLSIVNVVHR